MTEQVIQCPRCAERKCYLNVNKKVAICFRASCGFKAGPAQLARLGLVDLSLEDLRSEPILERPMLSIKITVGATPLVFKEDNELMTRHPIASAKVQERGVNAEDQYRFDLHIDTQRVYIPIHSGGELVQYIGRSHWWYSNEYQRYKYATGVNVTKYLFNWDEMRTREYITIVENTFNAIRYRELVNSVSCFGSNLSKEQVLLISRSPVKFCIILMDEGAEGKACEAMTRLRDSGVQTKYLKIKGQPDDYEDSYIAEIVNKAL